MIYTAMGKIGGYGYNAVASVANRNIVSDIVAHVKTYDARVVEPAAGGNGFSMQTVSIQVASDMKVRINEGSPVLVESGTGLNFECANVYSLAFDTNAINYNITFSYT